MTDDLNIGDATAVAERRSSLTARGRGEDEAFRGLMNQPAFRAFAWRFLGEAQVFQPIMTGNSYTFLNEGKRQMGLWLLEQINRLCPELYVTMTKEAQARAKKGNTHV